jgi:hypothetical protein
MRLPSSKSRRILFLSLYLLFCWGVAVLGIKLYWRIHAGVPFAETPRNWDHFYWEIRSTGVREAHPKHDDDSFDVLLLGGSVLDPEWGQVEKCLVQKLDEEIGPQFRVFNLARPGHTSRDSLLKFSLLPDEQFELVIVYDGINDVRLNCCPRELFREDYSHCSWYYEIETRVREGRMSAPAGLADEFKLVHNVIFLNSGIDPRMVEHGGEIKTDRTLRRNHKEILQTAATRGDTVLLLTYAYDIPENYLERLKNGTLQYGAGFDNARCFANGWGKPQHVVATLDAQNTAIRELAGEFPDALFVDERQLMPEQEQLFFDACHLSHKGSRQFIENLWPAVQKRLAAWRANRSLIRPGKADGGR